MTTLYPPRKAVKTVSVAAVRWSLAVVFAISMATSFVVSVQAQGRDDQMRHVVATQQQVVDRARADTRNLCLAANRSAANTNAVIDSLGLLVNRTGALPTKDQKARLRIIAGLRKVPVTECKP